MFSTGRMVLVLTWATIILTIDEVKGEKNENVKKTLEQCDHKKMEEMFNTMTIIPDKKRNFPETIEELPTFCKEQLQFLSNFDQYRKQCFNETLKNMAGMIIYGVRSRIKKMCRNKKNPDNKQIKEMLSVTPCLNRNKKPLNKCMEKGAIMMFGLRFEEESKRIPQICCHHKELVDCSKSVLENSPVCNHLSGLVDEMIANSNRGFMEQMCGEYTEDSDKCAQLKPIVFDEKLVTSKSLLFNILELFSS